MVSIKPKNWTDVRIKDKRGQKYGFLTVIGYAGNEIGETCWEVECVCGTVKVVRNSVIASAKPNTSCGCQHTGYINWRKEAEERYVGRVVDGWLIKERTGETGRRLGIHFIECLDCGHLDKEYPFVLIKRSKDCKGCHSGILYKYPQITPEGFKRKDSLAWNRWKGILERCLGESNTRNYKDKGITVYEEWTTSYGFINFFDWLQSKYPNWEELFLKGYEIDREDNFAGYSPENCRLVTRQKNVQNRSITYKVDYYGEMVPLSALVDEFSLLPYETVRSRCRSGWDTELALITPKGTKKKEALIKYGAEINGR